MLRWLKSQGWDIILVLCPLSGEEKNDSEISALASECSNLIYIDRSGLLQYHADREDIVACVRSLQGMNSRDYAAVLRENDPSNPVFRLNYIIQTFSPDVLIETLLALEQKLAPRIVLANYVFMTRGLPLLGARTLKIVDTIDVFSTKASKVCAFGIEDFAMTSAEEAALLARADVALAIQAEEGDELRRIAPSMKVVTVGVDMPGPPRSNVFVNGKVILLVASKNPMNLMGLRDFLRFSWPRVIQAHPDAELQIIGAVGDVLFGDEPRVKALGRVDDLASHYEGARLVINPAVAGTGLKIKTLEALAHLRPIVLWPSGVDGVSPNLRSLCECVTDWFEFTRSVIRHLDNDEAGNRIRTARDRIRDLLSPKTVYAELEEIIQKTASYPSKQLGSNGSAKALKRDLFRLKHILRF
jgi:Glycosyl transferases group 1